MKSIRRYQLVVLVAGTVTIVAAATIVHQLAIRRSLTREFDAALTAKAASLRGMLEYDAPYVEFDFAASAMPQYSPGPDAEYFQLWVDGKVFARSNSLGTADLPLDHRAIDGLHVGDLALPDGRRGRAAGIRFDVQAEDSAISAKVGPPEAALVVARSREPLLASLATLTMLSIVEGAMICACVCVLVVMTIERAMARVRHLADQVDGIDWAKLHHRVDETGMPEELEPIAAGLNRLLARTEAAFQRERRVNANIAHELRTPVAELRTATDVALKWSDDAELASRTVVTAASIAQQMETIVASLLRLARIQSGQLVFRPTPVDLSRAVTKHWNEVAPAAAERGVRTTIDVAPGLVVATDADGLELILQNLLANAVAHCPDGGWIRCVAEVDGPSARVRIANAHETLEAKDRTRLTEAFWTKTSAREGGREGGGDGSAHAGLGLTLVNAVAEMLDARVSFEIDDAEFIATVEFRLFATGRTGVDPFADAALLPKKPAPVSTS